MEALSTRLHDMIPDRVKLQSRSFVWSSAGDENPSHELPGGASLWSGTDVRHIIHCRRIVTASAPSSLDLGVESLQLHTRILDAELPVHTPLFRIRLVGPDRDFPLQFE